jgi:hypothetical protein
VAKKSEIVYQPRTLTPEQRAAAAMLADGKTPNETAEALGLPVVMVMAWADYVPEVWAEVNKQRKANHTRAADKLRSMVPDALDALKDELNGPDRIKAAGIVLKLAEGLGAPDGKTDATAIVSSMASDYKHDQTWGPSEYEKLAVIGRLNAQMVKCLPEPTT